MTTAQELGSPHRGGHFERFRREFEGSILCPGDAQYDSARKVWNASIDKRPTCIARCTGIADVISAANFAREEGMALAIRGGGHNVGGRALCKTGWLLTSAECGSDPAESERHQTWARGLNEALRPYSSGGYLLARSIKRVTK